MRNVLTASAAAIVLASGVVRSAQVPAQNTSVNPEVILLKQSADLVAKDLGFNGLGEVTLTLHNRGDQAVNPLTRARGAGEPPKIQVDLYIGGTLVESVYQPSLGGKASRVFTIKPQTPPKCGDSRDLKVVVDPHNTITELHDDNNATNATVARPCPDLAVHSIERDYTGVLKETYSPKVVIINKGNWPTPAMKIWATALSSAPGITGWPAFVPTKMIPALAPGEKTSFHVGGSVLSADNSWIRIILDREFKIDELDESNNFVDKKL